MNCSTWYISKCQNDTLYLPRAIFNNLVDNNNTEVNHVKLFCSLRCCSNEPIINYTVLTLLIMYAQCIVTELLACCLVLEPEGIMKMLKGVTTFKL